MADVDVHLNIAMTPRAFRGALFLFALCALPGELASEAVTLNSYYYPAPSGIYKQMITTGNTYLARDGGYVGIGVAASVGGVGTMYIPTSTSGTNSTKLMVLNGTGVGIGTPTPAEPLDVQDSRAVPASVSVSVAVNGQILIGAGSTQARINFNQSFPTYFEYMGVDPTRPNIVALTRSANFGGTITGNYGVFADQAGNVGIGVLAPVGHLDVNGIVVGRTADIIFSLP